MFRFPEQEKQESFGEWPPELCSAYACISLPAAAESAE